MLTTKLKVLVDGTHIKANANTKIAVKKAAPKIAEIYEEQFMKEINEDRECNFNSNINFYPDFSNEIGVLDRLKSSA